VRIAIGSDHAGYKLKEFLKAHLRRRGHKVIDFGTDSDVSVDYPRFIFPVALAVAAGRIPRGIVLGGSGNGEAMAANRVRGVRAALCWNEKSARFARLHNDANVISMGARMVPPKKAAKLVDIWLKTEFEGGRHVRRIRLLDLPPSRASSPRSRR
jgi:ribose 5-phosphate isomerase B